MGRRRLVLKYTPPTPEMAEHGCSIGNAEQGSEYALGEPSNHKNDFL